MNPTSAHTLSEVAHQDQEIVLPLTAHAYYVVMRTMSLKLVELTEKYSLVVHRDRYVVSAEQDTLRRSIIELTEALNELG